MPHGSAPRSSVDGVVADAQDKGREAVGAMRDVSDNFVEAIDESLKNRPYTTLAIVAGLGFLFGATWRADDTDDSRAPRSRRCRCSKA